MYGWDGAKELRIKLMEAKTENDAPPPEPPPLPPQAVSSAVETSRAVKIWWFWYLLFNSVIRNFCYKLYVINID